MRAAVRSALATALPAVLLAFALLVYAGLLDLDRTSEIIPIVSDRGELEKTGDHLGAVVSAVDGTAGMLMTIQIGLFVMVGFAFGGAFRGEDRLALFAVAASAAFVACSFVSLHFGFIARLQLTERVTTGSLDYEAVAETLTHQGVWLGIAAAFAVAAVAWQLAVAQDKPLRTGSTSE
ncbi:MAG TPA: hypothetical protein VGN97_06190 [Mesorhizobium sp.]|jgi:hypothetical protein|nr:hypothetical protein [Mesorhizobium sp.]